jgi:hypothetical protein
MTQVIKNILRKIKISLLMLEVKIIGRTNFIASSEFFCEKTTKRCFDNRQSPYYRYEYFGKNTPSCCASHLYTLLSDVSEVFHFHNLEYFISFGTLLGSVRHKGLIPWDTDIDLVVPLKNKENILATLQESLGDKYWIQVTKEDCIAGESIRVYLSHTNTLHIDIFYYIEELESLVFGYNRRFLKKDISPLVLLPFYDMNLYAPKNYDEQLTLFYGKDYKTHAYRQWAWNKNKFSIKDFMPAKLMR